MTADLLYTTKRKDTLQHETSFIFSFFLQKTSVPRAIILTICAEIFIMILLPTVLLHNLSYEISAIVGIFFAMTHIQGIIQNRVFFKKLEKS